MVLDSVGALPQVFVQWIDLRSPGCSELVLSWLVEEVQRYAAAP